MVVLRTKNRGSPLLNRFSFVRTFLLCVIILISMPVHGVDWVYTVVDGDNLWDFSSKYLDSVMRFEQIRKLNNIKNPKRLKPGSWLRVPMKWIRRNAVPAQLGLVEGQVEITRSDGTEEKGVKPGALIHLGDTLKTGHGSSAAIVFADTTKLTLHSDAEMRFDHLSAHGETGMVDSRIHLSQGRLKTQVKPAVGPGSRFEIKTPSAITAVRGTAYRVSISPKGEFSNIEVLEGSVVVSGADQQTLVAAGYGTRVSQGQPPIKPKKLLPSPQLSQIPEPLRALNWRLNWQPLEGANSYRVEISRSNRRDVVLWELKTNESSINLPDLADGSYWLRVRGIDSTWLEGNSVEHGIILDRHPLAPQSLSPEDGEMLNSGNIDLQWERSSDAHSYFLEVATDLSFENTIVAIEIAKANNFVMTDVSKPGVYYWRVSAKSESGELGPAGDIRSWKLRSELEPPKVDVTVDDEKLLASWKQLNSDHRYHVQLAHDPEFNHLELDQVVAGNEIRIEHIYSQLRYLRVCAVEEDDYHGPWSSLHKIDPLLGKSIWIVPTSLIMGLLFL